MSAGRVGKTAIADMARISNVNFRAGICARVAQSLVIAIFLVGCFFSINASGQLVESEGTGTSSKTYRKKAIARIPFDKMQPAAAKRISDIVNHSSLYRQLPVTTIQSDPDMYLFLLRYPETIISTWKLMGVSQMDAHRTGAFQLHATDGAGTKTNADLVYGQPNLNIYYAEGEYEGPMLFRKVTAKCVIMIESNYRRGSDGKIQVTSRMNFFLKIDNLAASIIAKTIHPLVGTTADHNFVETLKFVEKLSQTSGRNGAGVQRMANRLEGLRPDVRQRFQEIAGITWQRAQERAHGQSPPLQPTHAATQNHLGATQRNSGQRAAVQAAYQQPTIQSATNRSGYRPQRSSGVTHHFGDR